MNITISLNNDQAKILDKFRGKTSKYKFVKNIITRELDVREREDVKSNNDGKDGSIRTKDRILEDFR